VGHLTNAHTIGDFSRNMLFVDNVGQNVCANLPKLRRHLPSTSGDLQVLQIQSCKCQFVLLERADPTKRRSEDSDYHTRHRHDRRSIPDQYLALLTYHSGRALAPRSRRPITQVCLGLECAAFSLRRRREKGTTPAYLLSSVDGASDAKL
jgi:hypothetical protein